jgi:hypothetical protein
LLAVASAVLLTNAALAALADVAEARPIATAKRGPRATLAAAFTPKRLGAATTVTVGLKIHAGEEIAPAPVSSIELRFPSNLGFATSGLGLASCDPQALQKNGAAVCPADSRVGSGSAVAAVGFGPTVVREGVSLESFAAPSTDGYLHLAILASGDYPVVARIVLSAVLLAGRLRISVPEVPGLPGGPNVALAAITATLGGSLTYFEHTGGRDVAYRPKGIGLPDHCPRGGWKLAARLAFADGTHSAAETVIPCPHRSGDHG